SDGGRTARGAARGARANRNEAETGRAEIELGSVVGRNASGRGFGVAAARARRGGRRRDPRRYGGRVVRGGTTPLGTRGRCGDDRARARGGRARGYRARMAPAFAREG